MVAVNLQARYKIAAGALLGAAPAPVLAAAGGGLAFASPWMLLGLGALPVLYYILRSNEVEPEIVDFPQIEILAEIEDDTDHEPQRMPWWQMALNLGAAGAVVTALAGPQWLPPQPLDGDGPIGMIVGNGWASAPGWERTMAYAGRVLDRAEEEGRPVVILPSVADAQNPGGALIGPMNAAQAREALLDLKPSPWPEDHAAIARRVSALGFNGSGSLLWLSDGLDQGDATQNMIRSMAEQGRFGVVSGDHQHLPHLLSQGAITAQDLSVHVRRAADDGDSVINLSAVDDHGAVAARAQAVFAAGQTEAVATIALDRAARQKLSRIVIDGEHHAGATLLLDERWQRRAVGLVSDRFAPDMRSLQSEVFFIERALSPYVDMQQGKISDLAGDQVSILILPDGAAVFESDRRAIHAFVDGGGTLLRFAGPHLALREGGDDLLPVPLRPGIVAFDQDRGRVGVFDQKSPLREIPVPADVAVSRALQPQPSSDLDDHVWARLADGTPFVTARQQGQGWSVLVHTTANAEWADLSLSGSFVEMIRAVVAHSRGLPAHVNSSPLKADGISPLKPIRVLDARGQPVHPVQGTRSLGDGSVAGGLVGPHNPPGLYGNDSLRYAHNLAVAVPEYRALSDLPDDVHREPYVRDSRDDSWVGPVSGTAMGLLLASLLVLMVRNRDFSPAAGRKPAVSGP